jgi:hypothetical protein
MLGRGAIRRPVLPVALIGGAAMLRTGILAAAFGIVLMPLGIAAEPDGANANNRTPKPHAVPKRDRRQTDAAIERGVDFLLDDQNKDGSWGSAQKTKGLNIYAPVPGAHHAFRTAVTAICLSALIETGIESDRVQSAIDRGEAWLFQNLDRLRRATPDTLYNVWGHGYAVGALARMHERVPDDDARRAQIRDLIRVQLERLARYESIDGGWGYYDFRHGTKRTAASSTSFVNAAVLVCMDEARNIGVAPPKKLAERAVAATVRQMKPDFTYLYGEYLKWVPMHPINQPGGSLGRSQACNVALRLFGEPRITDQVIETWLDRLFARNGWLSMGRKRPIPHESHFAVAGYFYYFGHYYAARCIDVLPSERRGPHQDQLAHILLGLQEKDGSWWDYPLYNYHQQYGTGFAIMSLVRCR